MSNLIRNIIFDLGGVLLNLDYEKTAKSFVAAGVSNFNEIYSQAKQTTVFDDLDKGLISAEEFRNTVNKLGNVNLSDKRFDEAWNAMLLDLPEERVAILKNIQANYRTFLLSNTNCIHMDVIEKYLSRTYRIKDFSPLFEKVYLSYKMGKRKPDAEIFVQVLSENKLKASETLFIDDSIQHIQGAQKLGIQTLFLEKGKIIESYFSGNFLTKLD